MCKEEMEAFIDDLVLKKEMLTTEIAVRLEEIPTNEYIIGLARGRQESIEFVLNGLKKLGYGKD